MGESGGKRTGLVVFNEALAKFGEKRDEDLTIYSEVPMKCKKVNCYVGIDEAGRGPVLGPMVYGIFAAAEADAGGSEGKGVDEDDKVSSSKSKAKGKKGKEDTSSVTEILPPLLIDSIKKLNDSKQLTEKIREEIFAQFSELDHVAFGIKIISPTQISAQSFRRQKVSLNELSHNAAMELIQGLIDRGISIEKVYVDTVGPMDKYQKKLEYKFPELKFKVDKKADAKYKPVSAASICAKVTRDEALKNWTFPNSLKVKIPEDGWGSGYPGDPVTKRFLRKNIDPVFGFPNIVRESWGTASELLDKNAVKVIWEIEDDAAQKLAAPKISNYFGKASNTNTNLKRKRRGQFFFHRNLKRVGTIF